MYAIMFFDFVFEDEDDLESVLVVELWVGDVLEEGGEV